MVVIELQNYYFEELLSCSFETRKHELPWQNIDIFTSYDGPCHSQGLYNDLFIHNVDEALNKNFLSTS